MICLCSMRKPVRVHSARTAPAWRAASVATEMSVSRGISWPYGMDMRRHLSTKLYFTMCSKKSYEREAIPSSKPSSNRFLVTSIGRADDIARIKKYLELAETLHRVEADKAKLASLSSQFYSDEKGARQRPNTDVTDQSREILMGRSKYSGKSVSEAAYEMLREANRAMHAKELVQRLVEGGLQIKGKTPLTSVATSLKRDKRFKKVGPNTFE